MSYDLSKCLVNFTECPEGIRLVEQFPALSAFKEFQDCQDENFIKIAICTGDPESPFIKIKDRELMLKAVFQFIVLSIDTEEEKNFYYEVFNYQHQEVLECFAAYLRACHDIDWTEYQATKQTYDVLVAEANRPRGKEEDIDKFIKRRVNIQNHLKSIGEDLKKAEAKIFPDSKAAREIAMLENKKIITYAEKYAEEHTHI